MHFVLSWHRKWAHDELRWPEKPCCWGPLNEGLHVDEIVRLYVIESALEDKCPKRRVVSNPRKVSFDISCNYLLGVTFLAVTSKLASVQVIGTKSAIQHLPIFVVEVECLLVLFLIGFIIDIP